jgi:hypothetical protein
VLLKMMAKKPEDRFGSAQEVVDALAPFGTENSLAHLLGIGALEEATGESPVQPLPHPLPEELSRLTAATYETPAIASGLAGDALPSAKSARQRTRWFWAAGACVVAGALALVLWHAASTPNVPRNDVDAAGWRLLDDLPPRQHHFLLDRKPFALGTPADDSAIFRWDKGDQVVNLLDPGYLLLILGKNSRPRFSFEAAVSQAPWTGNVGIFWGYREDPAKEKDETYKAKQEHGPFFGTFQMLKLVHEIGDHQENRYFVERIAGKIRHNKGGQIAPDLLLEARQSIEPPRNGVALLQIEVENDRPKIASINGFVLNMLYGPGAAQTPLPDTCVGGLGLISLSHTASFRNARFIAYSVP